MRQYYLSYILGTGRVFCIATYDPVAVVCVLVACYGSVSNVSVSPVSWHG